MANAFYNRGASFNPDELADGDAIEAEFDSVSRGFDTIEDLVDLNKAGYPSQTFHVAPATETTHAVQKAQLDASVASLNDSISVTNADLDKLLFEVETRLPAASYSASDVLAKLKTVDGNGSGLDADSLDGYGGERYSRSEIGAGYDGVNFDAMTGYGCWLIQCSTFSGAGNPPPANCPYGILVVDVAQLGGEQRLQQTYFPHNNDSDKYIYHRIRNAGVWTSWSKIWRGGTGDGSGLVANSVAGTAQNGGVLEIVKGYMASNDAFRIALFGSDNGGAVEIATADDGNEPIYVRQYNGLFGSVARSLTLLDADGNTSLPGKLIASGHDLGAQGAGLFAGNGDAASSQQSNVDIRSWCGIGFKTTIGGQPVPYMENSHWFNTRNGDAGMRGSLSVWGNIQCNGVLSSGSWLSSVAVLTGQIWHGGTLPIPNGYSEGQCRFFVSLYDSNSNSVLWDLREGIRAQHYREVCFVAGRTVNAYMRVYNDTWDGYEDHGTIANYLVIGVK